MVIIQKIITGGSRIAQIGFTDVFTNKQEAKKWWIEYFSTHSNFSKVNLEEIKFCWNDRCFVSGRDCVYTWNEI